MQAVKAGGKGNKPMRKRAPAQGELQQMWDKEALGYSSPKTLQQTIWWILCTRFGKRANKGNYDMRLGDFIVRGLNLQKHHDCSHRSTSTNVGPGLDMTILYQFLEGAKMGSLCGSHFGQIQDGRHPE